MSYSNNMSTLIKDRVEEEVALKVAAGELYSNAIPRQMYMETTFHCPKAEFEVQVSNVQVPDCSDESDHWQTIATLSKVSWISHPFKWIRVKLGETRDTDTYVYVLSGPEV